MVNARRWLIPTAVKFVPTEGSSLDTETPDIVDGLGTCVTTIDKKVGLREDNRVTISASRGGANDRHDHPLGHVLAISHIKKVQIVTCKGTTTSGSTVDDHLHLFDVRRRVGSSGRRGHSLD